MQPPDPDQLTQAIKAEALRLGFQAVGIVSSSALENRAQDLTRWLESGFAGELAYMESFFKRQANLQANCPDGKSVVVLAVAYSNPDLSSPPVSQNSEQKSQPPPGRVARYAQGRNYHRVIDKRLRQLERFLQAHGENVRVLRCVDTRPIQERALGEAAGIGFFGKNSCLIRPGVGSFFFLAALITNLELLPDEPIRWDCGACTLCLQACPTEALIRPYELDARRCISYLTIELKEAIDPELRSQMGDWLFGCDICQEVCPYNRKGKATPWVEFWPATGQGDPGAQLPVEELLTVRTEEAFQARFAGTSLMRAKRAGLLRNAAVVAGNLQDPCFIHGLSAALLEDSSPLVRQHAAWALGKIRTGQALQALRQALQKETQEPVRKEIKAALLLES